MQRSASLRRRPLRTPLQPSLSRTGFRAASNAQRAKVVGKSCIACGRSGRVDPAHLVPRAQGGCDDPDCVVPLCRRCHRALDDGGLDLLPRLEPAHRRELAHALLHVGLAALVRRVTARPLSDIARGG